MASTTRYESWGRYPVVAPRAIVPVRWRDNVPDLATLPASVLPYAYGRSYGDSCLNAGGIALDVTGLRRFIAFDDVTGLLQCEAGVMLADILDYFVPRGWFLPVSPGTKYVSVGGAIANDIHGKNHHRAGTFGRHVTRFEIVRSTGERFVCAPDTHADLYRATIGGLGLTGLITWAEIALKPIVNAYIDAETIRFDSLDEFFSLTAQSDATHEYTVAWADCLIGGAGLIRGHFMRGNHDPDPERGRGLAKKPAIPIPLTMPNALLNLWTGKAFNTVLYYGRQRRKTVRAVIPYEPFFYPLDTFSQWNRLYGTRGLLQWQCVVPQDNNNAAIKEIFRRAQRAGEASFLTVLKTFGDLSSPGLMSFPRPGVTLNLDFAFHGACTLALLEDLDGVVRESGGAVYPAKDARMSMESFQTFFPQWKQFACFIDPKFSSSFWRRVTDCTRQER